MNQNQVKIDKQFAKIEADCLKAISKLKGKWHPDLKVKVSSRQVEIYILDTNPESNYFNRQMWASDINFYCEQNRTFEVSKARISFGTTGSFDPSDISAYYRTIHAANLLQNWDKAVVIINDTCLKYNALLKSLPEETN